MALTPARGTVNSPSSTTRARRADTCGTYAALHAPTCFYVATRPPLPRVRATMLAVCRLGWATDRASAAAPLGMDQHGYAYRDVNGSVVHQSIRRRYGERFGKGDVIGCLIEFDAAAERLAALAALPRAGLSAGPLDAARQYSVPPAACQAEKEAALIYNATPPQPCSTPVEGVNARLLQSKHSVRARHWGSLLTFFKNGVSQGPAFMHLTQDGPSQRCDVCVCVCVCVRAYARECGGTRMCACERRCDCAVLQHATSRPRRYPTARA
ncbi:hypothetical protein EON67_00940 [archaeon]|nr:MAG: hypothetical protein EON67_00940 [archaeon]